MKVVIAVSAYTFLLLTVVLSLYWLRWCVIITLSLPIDCVIIFLDLFLNYLCTKSWHRISNLSYNQETIVVTL